MILNYFIKYFSLSPPPPALSRGGGGGCASVAYLCPAFQRKVKGLHKSKGGKTFNYLISLILNYFKGLKNLLKQIIFNSLITKNIHSLLPPLLLSCINSCLCEACVRRSRGQGKSCCYKEMQGKQSLLALSKEQRIGFI